ncbi:MAG: rhomboid family intramembrane serine protease, partial [Desulfuromonadales bacterium]|nr:rhomboid family intramembrane serine protease [Desulfuromonadales bacterium]NIR33609.1 rhomboid family intramembrane serine protease [Desulfuromonadales bacterium]NIS43986.1 rhomboid family intramembrane serine protease [Desulfuromonadales bacterium]
LNDPILYDYLQALGVRGAVSAQSILDQVSAYEIFTFRYGYRPADPSILTLFTAMFLHGGWMHLGGNMLFLWIFGDNVEHRLGRVGYLLAYLGTGMAATVFFAVFVPGSQVPLIGASGAISGVLGLYYFWFPRNQVKTFIFLFPFIMNTFLIPARLVLGFYLVIDNILPFLVRGGTGSGVAHGAHIGGFIAGLGGAYLIDRLPQWKRRTEVRLEEEKESPEGSAAPLSEPERISRNVRMGSLSRAAADYLCLEGAGERLRVKNEDVLKIGEFLYERGDYLNALSVYRRFISERPADPLLARAYIGAGRAMIHQPRSIPAAYQYFLQALDVADSRATADEARMHLRAIERLGEED